MNEIWRKEKKTQCILQMSSLKKMQFNTKKNTKDLDTDLRVGWLLSKKKKLKLDEPVDNFYLKKLLYIFFQFLVAQKKFTFGVED